MYIANATTHKNGWCDLQAQSCRIVSVLHRVVAVRIHADKKTRSTLISCTAVGLQQASLLGWANLAALF
jgi:hypothetical protein